MFYAKELLHKNRARHAEHNTNLSYAHAETPQIENNNSNNYKQFKTNITIPLLQSDDRYDNFLSLDQFMGNI